MKMAKNKQNREKNQPTDTSVNCIKIEKGSVIMIYHSSSTATKTHLKESQLTKTRVLDYFSATFLVSARKQILH